MGENVMLPFRYKLFRCALSFWIITQRSEFSFNTDINLFLKHYTAKILQCKELHNLQ